MKGYLFVMAVAAAVTFLATPGIRRMANSIGAMTEVRDRDVHVVPVARLGGLAMLIGMLSAWAIASQMPWLGQIFQRTQGMYGILIAVVAIALLGWADDVWGLDALTKLTGQALAASAVVWKGITLSYIPLFGITLFSQTTTAVLTVFLIVVVINAVNFIDGLDGLAAGVTAIAGIAFFLYSYTLARVITQSSGIGDYASVTSLVLAGMVGACIGFLPHNFHPARLFMGDSGSMMLGLLMGVAMVAITGQMVPNAVSGLTGLRIQLPIFLPIAVVALPMLDMSWAISRRLLAGQAPWSPDKLHLHHRVMSLGHSHFGAVMVLYAWTALISLGALILGFSAYLPLPVWVSASLSLMMVVAVVLYTFWPGRMLGVQPETPSTDSDSADKV